MSPERIAIVVAALFMVALFGLGEYANGKERECRIEMLNRYKQNPGKRVGYIFNLREGCYIFVRDP